MAEKKIRIIHIDTGKEWRGGQQQAFYLHKELIKNRIFSVLFCNPESIIYKKCKEDNLSVHKIKMLSEIDLVAAFKIFNYCRKENINVIQCHSGHAHSIGLLAKILLPNVILLTVRRVDFHIRKNKLSLLKYNSRFVDGIICVSNAIRNVLIEDGIDEKKLFTIHDGIDIKKFLNVSADLEIAKRFKPNSNQIIIGTVAAIVGHKDYPTLINAAKIVTDKFENVTFLALGSGSLKLEMEKLVNTLNLTDKFIFAGFQVNVPAFFKFFNIFVLSSKLEGLGTSILDAQAMGLPVISTMTGGIPEIIDNEVNGILVQTKNPAQLADAIIDLIDNPEKAKKLGAQALNSVNQFSVESLTEKNIELYKKLLMNV